MPIDPICGMTVDEKSLLRSERGGRTFYFCCKGCRQKFLDHTPPTTAILLAPINASGHGHDSGTEAAGSSADCCRSGHRRGGHEHKDAPVKASAVAKYFCPMCPAVGSDRPGACPKCGMALERNPAVAASPAGKTIYTCPMHPEVQQDHPGDCPKCGMALEPKTVSAMEDENPELADMTRRFGIGAALARDSGPVSRRRFPTSAGPRIPEEQPSAQVKIPRKSRKNRNVPRTRRKFGFAGRKTIDNTVFSDKLGSKCG
jgi:Cu+-exporting ATPase